MSTRVNLVANPSFEESATLWTPGSKTTVAQATGVAGSPSTTVGKFLVGASASSDRPQSAFMPVTAGVTYTLSCYLYLPTGFVAQYAPSIFWYNSSGTYLGSTLGQLISAGGNGAFTRYSVSHVPVGTGVAQAAVILNGSSASIPAGAAYYLDEVLFEAAATAGTYFDGDTPADSSYTYAWNGTAGLSASTATSVTPPPSTSNRKIRVAGAATTVNRFVRSGGVAVAVTRKTRVGGVAK